MKPTTERTATMLKPHAHTWRTEYSTRHEAYQKCSRCDASRVKTFA